LTVKKIKKKNKNKKIKECYFIVKKQKRKKKVLFQELKSKEVYGKK